MLFLVVVAFLTWSSGLAALASERCGCHRAAAIHFVISLFGAAGLAFGLFGLHFGAPLPGGANTSAWCLLGLAAGSIGSATYRLCRLRCDGGDVSTGGWRTGISLWTIFGGAYVCGALADNALFLAGPRAGVVDARVMKVQGIECHSPVLVRISVTGPSTFRCPRNVVWGRWTGTPLVPWPSYSEGTSSAIGPTLDSQVAKMLRTEK